MSRFYTTTKGYRFDRIIFYVMFGLVLMFFGYVFAVENFNTSTHVYINCKEEYCQNPLLDPSFICQNELKVLWFIPIYEDKNCMRNCNEEWCEWKYLPRGEYGRKKPPYILAFPWFTLAISIMGIIANHLIHNKGKKFDAEIRISKTKILRLPDDENKNKGND